MKKNIAKKWVEALRSGDYDQCAGSLVSVDRVTGNESFCCLGVLCNLATEHGVGEWAGGTDVDFFDEADNSDNELPPPGIAIWAGMSERGGGAIMFNEESKELAELNDGGMSFLQIADLIEANWEDL